VLGRTEQGTAVFRVAQDASVASKRGEVQNVDARELAVSPQTQSVVVLGRTGTTWKDDGNQWQPFLTGKFSAIAYPG